MGITLNVWIFSGIIGAAYIMGYLMSRTMGRVLALEGADPAAQEETAPWSEKTGNESRARFGRGTRFESAAVLGRGAQSERTAVSGRGALAERAAVFGKGAQSERAAVSEREAEFETTMASEREAEPETTMMFEREAEFERAAVSEEETQRETAVMSGRTTRRNAAMPRRGMRPGAGAAFTAASRHDTAARSQRAAQSENTAWTETEEEPEMPVRQESRTQAGRAGYRGQSARESDREMYGGETREWQKARVQRRYRGRSRREQQTKPAGHPIASPVAGQVDVLEGQGRRGVLLTPEDNRVYAPASGKIIRLYPRGNEFLLRTDSGVVLRLQAGERDAEMTRDYFRPRIMQNEFVGKGKLLLEYDREALARDGYDTHVSMTVEEEERSYDLSVTGSMWVKNGQDCLWVL